jgi:hypothetical protein
MARQDCGPGSAFGLVVAIGAAFAAACGSSSSAARGRPDVPDARPEPVPGRAVRVAPSYANQGGMWLPSQMPGRTEQLQRLGIDIDPGLLSDPASPLLQAMVDLGGCSAAFVSPEGLIVTSHHCARSALQYSSTPEHNLLDLGFLARTRAEEKWNGPVARAYVTQRVHDVTAAMSDGLDAIADDTSRHAEIEARQKKLVAECEGRRPQVRCRVERFFDGAQWLRIQSLEIRDIRLVYAPQAGIGWFGGGHDSWMWPRHTGDFAFYRAYVGPDGVPADHSEKNIPYRSQHRLKIASKPLREGDLVVVAGFPGATSRHRTAAEVDEAVSWKYPRKIARDEAVLAALRGLGERDAEAAAAAAPINFAAENRLKKTRGLLDGLVKAGAVDRRRRADAALAAWIDEDADRRAAWGQVLGQLERLHDDRRGARERDAALAELGDARLLAAALTIVRMAEERGIPDAQRDPRYQQRNWKKIEAGLGDLERRYHRDVDGALLSLALIRAADDLDSNRSWLERALERRAMAAAESGDDQAIAREIERLVRRLYAATRLEREDVRLQLVRGATVGQLARSADPMIRLAMALRPVQKEIEDGDERLAGAAALVRPRYMAALRAFHGDVAPDANGTLRIAFGTVRGFRPRPDAPMLRPFTTLRELVARHRSAATFAVPDAVLAAAGRDVGPYRDHKLDDVPVDFLSDADTAAGNSGSATLNARGELCGLLFDSTIESVSGDWLYMPDSHRSIHVDIRYAAWIMDAVDGADHLLAEMGVTPSL